MCVWYYKVATCSTWAWHWLIASLPETPLHTSRWPRVPELHFLSCRVHFWRKKKCNSSLLRCWATLLEFTGSSRRGKIKRSSALSQRWIGGILICKVAGVVTGVIFAASCQIPLKMWPEMSGRMRVRHPERCLFKFFGFVSVCGLVPAKYCRERVVIEWRLIRELRQISEITLPMKSLDTLGFMCFLLFSWLLTF